MAEMTVAEAVEFCSGWKDEELPFITGETLTQIAALLEQQAAEIKRLNRENAELRRLAELPKIPVESPFRMHDICKSIGFIPMSEFTSGQSVDMDRTILSARSETIEDMERRIAERDAKIERQERMIEKAVETLESKNCPKGTPIVCSPQEQAKSDCLKCWRKWLEQEVNND